MKNIILMLFLILWGIATQIAFDGLQGILVALMGGAIIMIVSLKNDPS